MKRHQKFDLRRSILKSVKFCSFICISVSNSLNSFSPPYRTVRIKIHFPYQGSGLFEGRESAEPPPQLLALPVVLAALVERYLGVAEILGDVVGSLREVLGGRKLA